MSRTARTGCTWRPAPASTLSSSTVWCRSSMGCRSCERCAQRSQDRQPIDDRHHTVEDDKVEAGAGRHVQPVLAVRDMLDGMAFLLEAARQVVRGFAIVLDDQD